MEESIIPVESISSVIHVFRGQKVLLDSDLADLYQVETRVLNQAVKRHLDRFPDDFMFRLSREEFDHLRSQSVIASLWGGRRTPPYAFTEQGVAMLSSVLNSPRAIHVNISIMRAFVKLREILASNRKLARKLGELEERYDQRFKVVFDALDRLSPDDSSKKKRKIGFGNRDE